MRILIVEDETDLAKNIQDVLLEENYQAETVQRGDDGFEQIMVEEYDLVILDIMLPGMDGIDVLKKIRAESNKTSVLLLTAKSEIEDRVNGLDAGADDYLTKPFAMSELLARVRSLLRRSSPVKSSKIELDNLVIDTSSREVWQEGHVISLTSKEYAILEFLLHNMNRVVSRLSIAEHVWGENLDLFSMTNFVDVHIKNLRKKIGDTKEKQIIKTVRGVGYILRDQL